MLPLALCAAAMFVLSGCGQGGGNGNGGGEASPTTAPEETSSLNQADGSNAVLASRLTETPAPSAFDVDEPSPSGPTIATGPADDGGTGSKKEKSKGSSGTGAGAGQGAKDAPPKKDDKSSGKAGPGMGNRLGGSAGQSRGLGNRGGQAPAKPQPQYDGDPIVIVEPETLELGEIPTNDAKTGVVKLKNTGDEPRTLINCKTNCGCTAANCQKGKTIKPGEEVEVEIRLSGGSVPRSLSKTVTFLISDQPPLQVPVRGEAISFVTVEPKILDPEKHPDGKIVLRAIDDQPFTVKSMYPVLFETEELPSEPAVVQEIYIPWDKWRDLGQQRKLLFSLDHPKSGKVYGTIAASAVDPTLRRGNSNRATGNVQTTPTRARGKANPVKDFDRLLKQGESDEAVKLVTDGEIEIDVPDRTGQTPLIRASRAGDVAVMQALIDASADISVTDRVGRTPLMYAAQSKNAEAVRVLLDAGADIARRDNLGNTTLSWASGFGDAETVQALIDAGARVDIVGAMTGFTPLIWAAGFGDPESIPILVEAGANVESPDALQGATPLMHAVRTGGIDNVRALLEAGADLEARDNQGKTPLLVAAANSGADAEIINMLIKAGADLGATDRAGHNALDLARKRTDMRASEVEELLATKIKDGQAPASAGAAGS
jgi:ankyrin repeat protein